MPALVAHHHFAVQALKQTPPHIQAAVSSAPDAFRWGAQGPDILYFFNVPLVHGKLPKTGKEMHHHKIARCWNAMLRFASQNDPALYFPYCAGFVCHYVLDRTAHPYVNSILSERLVPAYPGLSRSALHKLCESDLDGAVITNFISGEPQTFHSSTLLPADHYTQRQIGYLLENVCWNTYGVKINHLKIAHSMSSMIQAYSFLHDETGKRFQAVRGIEAAIGQPGELSSMIRPLLPLSEDCANLRHQPFGGTPSQKIDFFELMDSAYPVAAQLMETLYDCIRKGRAFPAHEFQINYLGQIE